MSFNRSLRFSGPSSESKRSGSSFLSTRGSGLVALVLLVALIGSSTGCVAPMGCGPVGCGPVALNDCHGCGDCNGCGELYIDPWINHPAECCDPCDQCGNFNGQSCGKCRSVFDGFASLWGYRQDVGSCCDSGCDGGCGPLLPLGSCGPDCGGCDSCGGCDGCGSCGSCMAGGALDSGAVYADSGYDVPTMHDAVATSEMPVQRQFVPSRTKKIFRPVENMVRAHDSATHR